VRGKKGRKASPVESTGYDRVFARLAANIPDLVAWISQQKHFAQEFCETLLPMPTAARERKVRDLARVEPWSVESLQELLAWITAWRPK
jgi:hypothetical protein